MLANRLLNLDIRLIDPFYGKRRGSSIMQDKNLPADKTDTGIFHYNNGDLEVLRLRGGYSKMIAALSWFLNFDFNLPTISRNGDDFLEEILAIGKPRETALDEKLNDAAFGKLARDYAFTTKSQQESIDSYLEYYKDTPYTANIINESHTVFQDEKVRQMEKIIIGNPKIAGIEGDVDKFYREIALYNKLSSCVVKSEERENLYAANPELISPLTITDAVIKNNEGKYTAIEFKVANPNASDGIVSSLSSKKSEQQLAKAAEFFIRNFRVRPNLVGIYLQLPKGKDPEFVVKNFIYTPRGLRQNPKVKRYKF